MLDFSFAKVLDDYFTPEKVEEYIALQAVSPYNGA